MGAPKPKTNIVPMRAWTEKEALAWLVGKGRIETSAAALGRDWRWDSKKVKTHLDRWSAAGHLKVKPGLSGRTVIMAPSAAEADPVPAVNVVPTVDGAATPVAIAPAPAASEAPAVAVAALPSEPATATAETEASAKSSGAKSVVAASAPDGPAASSPPADPAPDAAPVSAPAPPAHDNVALPARTDAPEPVVVRTPLATVLPPAPPVSAHPVSATPVPSSAHMHPRGSAFVNALAYVVAVSLATIAAFFSISGMIVLFPGAPTAIVTMGVVMEAAKLVTVAFLAHQWRTLAWLSRIVLVILVAGLAAINAAGVYSQLVAAHFGDRITATSEVETEAATLAARTEVQAQTVADIDRRVAQIDAAIAEMTRRGRAAGALDAIATQRKQRDALVGQRRQEADKLASLKSEAAAIAARNHRIEVEAAPIMYVAQMMGASTEQAIRMLILLMVLTCDPLALALTAAASRPRWRRPGM